jgi:hypothetical protein
MTHCSDDDLVLLYYGEEPRHQTHVTACGSCADRYRDLTATLQALAAADVPERGAHYGLEVWQQIRHRLPERETWWQSLLSWQVAAMAAAAVVLLVAGFSLGRMSQPAEQQAAAPAADAPDDVDARRVLLLTVADHLERSDRILTDIVNADSGHDISTEQAWAVDLVAASRLYRQEAIETNEASLAAVLDELERLLLEIVHRPSRVSDEDLQDIRRRIDSAALLFKVRVMSSELRELTGDAAEPSSPSSSTIG